MFTLRLVFIARIIICLTLAISGLLKLLSPSQASSFLSSLVFLKQDFSKILIILFSFFEILLGIVLLFWKSFFFVASLASSFVFLTFSLIATFEIDKSVSCGCFGDLIESKTGSLFLIRSLSLFFISLFVLKHSSSLTKAQQEKVYEKN